MTKISQLFNFKTADPSWHPGLKQALEKMNHGYLESLYHTTDWLPGHYKIFNAFSLPLNQTNYVLFGESPYPRKASANGYAFWDEAVDEIWSETGLSKSVNRATSLRNIIKMLLIAEGKLQPGDMSQSAIAKLNKNQLIKTNNELFNNFLTHGFLLLNATPVLRPKQVRQDAQQWQLFISHIIDYLVETRPNVELILLGTLANALEKLIKHPDIKRFYAEHPYNLSFITNSKILKFFQPFHLLCKNT